MPDYGYRWFDPLTGRWLSRDPIGERGGLNLYGFVWNNATNDFDVSGMYGYGVGEWNRHRMETGDFAPLTVPGTDIPKNADPLTTAQAVTEFLEKSNYYTCGKWGMKYKPEKTGGDVQHCMFGCLLTVANKLYGLGAGFTEITNPEWVDFKADYIGALHGLFSSSLSDCEEKCKKSMCCQKR